MKRSKRSLKLDALIVHELNRSHDNELDADYINSLKDDIGRNGLLHAITLKRCGEDQYEIVAGAHRAQALRKLRGDDGKLKPDEYQLVSGVMTDDDIVRISISENAKRHESAPIDLARYIVRLRSKHGVTQEQLSEYLEVSRQTVAAMGKLAQRFDELPAMWQRDLREPADERTVITITHWTELHSKLPASIPDEVVELMDQAWRESWSVRKTVRAIEGHLMGVGAQKRCEAMQASRAKKIAANKPPEEILQDEWSATPPDYSAVKDSLMDALPSCGADRKLSKRIIGILGYCEDSLLGVS